MKKITRIDSLRGIAILSVFAYHASLAVFGNYQAIGYKGFFIDTSDKKKLLLDLAPFSFGGTGVELFLVISGFLIHGGYLNSKANDWGKFFNKRFFRIYPPYLFALLVFSFALHASATDFITHLLLIHNLYNDHIFGTNPSFWSLALECQLYAIYPLFILLRQKLGIANAYRVVVAVGAVMLAGSFLVPISNNAYFKNVFFYWMIWIAGAYLAERYHDGKKIAGLNLGQLGLVLLGVLFICATRLGNYLEPFLFTLFYTLLMEWVLYAKVKVTKPLMLCYRFLVSVGLCSYSFYLIHQPFLRNMIDAFSMGMRNKYWTIAGVACSLFLLYVFSQLLYRFIELPSIKMGGILYNRYKKGKVASTPKLVEQTTPF